MATVNPANHSAMPPARQCSLTTLIHDPLRIGPWTVALTLVALYLGVGVFDHGIWSPTEPAVAGVVWSMFHGGSFAVPRINGLVYLEKPPLGYWASWLFCWLRGELDPGWMRLPSALVGLLCLYILYRSVKRRNGEIVSQFVVMMGATTLAFYELAHKSGPDIFAIAFIFAALATFVNSLGAETTLETSPRIRQDDFFVALILALSFYAKNLYPAFIALPPICIYLAQRRAWWRGLRLISVWLVLLVVVLLPWIFAVYHQAGFQALRIVFFDNVIGRFFDLRHTYSAGVDGMLNDALVVGKRTSPFYYVHHLTDMILPWTLIMGVGTCWFCFRRKLNEEDRFLRIAIGTIPLMLSFSSSKNGYYVLPIMFPMLLATGTFLRAYFDQAAPRPVTSIGSIMVNNVAVGLTLAVGVVFFAVKTGSPWLIVLASAAGAGIAWPIYRLIRHPYASELFVRYGVAMVLVCILSVAVAAPRLDIEKTNSAFFNKLKEQVEGLPVYTAMIDDRSMPLLTYYLDRRIEMLPKLTRSFDRLRAVHGGVLIVSERQFKAYQEEFQQLGWRMMEDPTVNKKFFVLLSSS